MFRQILYLNSYSRLEGLVFLGSLSLLLRPGTREILRLEALPVETFNIRSVTDDYQAFRCKYRSMCQVLFCPRISSQVKLGRFQCRVYIVPTPGFR